jgi:calcium-dependent protein kinase
MYHFIPPNTILLVINKLMGCIIKKNKINISSGTCGEYDLSIKPLQVKIRYSNFIKQIEGTPCKDYEIIKYLGKGSFGKVYKVKRNKDSKEFAMKIITKEYSFTTSKEEEVLKEINILKGLDHQNIIKIYEYFNTPNELYIITELCSGGELLEVIKEKKRLDELVVWKIMKQVLSAISYCHSYDIIHRDLKPQNILVSEYNGTDEIVIKVIDFGTSEILNKGIAPGLTGTVYFMAPEIVKLENYNSQCDLWSCGVIMYLLLSGDLPFMGNSQNAVFSKIKKGNLDFSKPIWSEVSRDAIDLIENLLNMNSEERYTAQEALNHPWIKCKNKNISKKSLITVFNHFNKFKVDKVLEHATLLYLVRNSQRPKDYLDHRRRFSSLDTNKDGRISYEELVQSFKIIMPEAEAHKCVKNFFQLIDTDDNGYIEFEEFMKVCTEKESLIVDANLKTTFNIFDLNKDGKICAKDLKRLFDKDELDDTEWELLISEHDKDRDGLIDFNEFKTMVNGLKAK